MDIKFSPKSFCHEFLTYQEYSTRLLELTENPERMQENDPNAGFYKLNLVRSSRVEKTYNVTAGLKKAVRLVQQPQLWMVICEPWCGDCAQNLPAIAKIANLNSNISLRILLRDQHHEVMDLYLTDGNMSIPKLIVFNMEEYEIFRWGPRPQPLEKLFRELKAKKMAADKIKERLHLWYGKDRCKTLDKEFSEFLMKATTNVVS
jgi:hypothetical protein